MGVTYIINAPLMFRGMWKIAKGFLDERTRKKIHMRGSDYKKDLLELVTPDQLPVFLGGTDETPFPSDKGPWQEYECVGNVLRKKGEKSENQEEAKVEEVKENAQE